MRLAILLLAVPLLAQAPPPDTLITGDGWRLEATGVAIAVTWEGDMAVIRATPAIR